MNRGSALPEMLNCMNAPGGNCTDMTVLDRQRARMRWQQQAHEVHHHQGYYYGCSNELIGHVPVQASQQVQSFQGLIGMGHQPVKPDPSLKYGYGGSSSSCGAEMNNISRTFSCPPKVAAESYKMINSPTSGDESLKNKRKANKGVGEEDSSEKRMKGYAEEGDSKITEQNSSKINNDRESSAGTSKENSKASEVQKPDYIHVRARRGQATDSHSLAERVRREKISERMKYLQELVPGCNKITGKAGMLDEIINYVQSLQRQVEFLSMKLAAVNPRLDFNIDDLFTKELFPENIANFPTIGMPSEMTSSAYQQFSQVQQLLQYPGLESAITSPDLTLLQRSISTPLSIPETFADTSCSTQVQNPTTWDVDMQNLFNVEFHQGRTAPFLSQPFSDSIEATNLKMEM